MEKATESKKQEIKAFSPRRYIITGILIILFFFGGLGAWAAFFPFSGAVIAPGTVKVSLERKTVQHLEGGIVEKIFVKEGDSVEEGQVLVRLKSSRVVAMVSLLQGQLWTKLTEFSRLKAESQFADTIVWHDALPKPEPGSTLEKMLQEEKEVFVSRKTDLLGKTKLYQSQIDQLKQQINGAQEQITANETIMKSLAEELNAKEALYKERYIDKAQLLVLRRALAEYQGKTGALRQGIAQTSQKIEETKLRIIDLRNTYQENAISELSRVSDQIYELREKLKPSLDQQERLEIRAPVPGVVINLKIHSEGGGILRAGEALMDIVPKDAELVIECRIRPDQITKVQKGQATKVQLTAFNRRKIPPVAGTVTYVSADQIIERTSAGQIPHYVAYVTVTEEELKEAGAYLSPGMPAVCYITTELRTILEYMLEPILENIDQALRETT